MEYRNSNLKIGLSGAATLLEKVIMPATYVYNDNAFRGNSNINIGFDAAYRYRRLLLFGEAAICANHAFDSTVAILYRTEEEMGCQRV